MARANVNCRILPGVAPAAVRDTLITVLADPQISVTVDMSDVRAHGRDERIGVKQFFEGLEFQYRLIKALSGR